MRIWFFFKNFLKVFPDLKSVGWLKLTVQYLKLFSYTWSFDTWDFFGPIGHLRDFGPAYVFFKIFNLKSQSGPILTNYSLKWSGTRGSRYEWPYWWPHETPNSSDLGISCIRLWTLTFKLQNYAQILPKMTPLIGIVPYV